MRLAWLTSLLTHSYHLYFDRKQTRKMQPYPPLGTLYAAALLRRAGISVALFDTMLKDPEDKVRSGARTASPANRRDIRGQFQFPFQDVSHANAGCCVSHTRRFPARRRHGRRQRLRRLRPCVWIICKEVSTAYSWERRNGLCWN